MKPAAVVKPWGGHASCAKASAKGGIRPDSPPGSVGMSGDTSPPWRVSLLGLGVGLLVLGLDVAAHPDLQLGPLYSLVVVVLSAGAHRPTVMVGTVATLVLLFLGTCVWPPGLGWIERATGLTLSASFICLVSGLLLQRMKLEEELLRAYQEREEAWAEVKVLRGLLRMCAWCKRIQDPEKGWVPIETFIAEHSEAGFTHGICSQCAAQETAARQADCSTKHVPHLGTLPGTAA